MREKTQTSEEKPCKEYTMTEKYRMEGEKEPMLQPHIFTIGADPDPGAAVGPITRIGTELLYIYSKPSKRTKGLK